MDEHLAGELCSCNPIPLVQGDSEILWQHKSFKDNTAEILDEADRILMAESILLWGKAEIKHKFLKIVPFKSAAPIRFPGTTDRR